MRKLIFGALIAAVTAGSAWAFGDFGHLGSGGFGHLGSGGGNVCSHSLNFSKPCNSQYLF